MRTFLFEQYGYYPKYLDNNVFEMDGWIFKLIKTDCEDKYIEEIDSYILHIRNAFFNKGPYIIRTRTNKKTAIFDNEKYVLISIDKGSMTLKDLNNFHCLFMEMGKSVDLKQLLIIWKERVYNTELEAINSLRVDSVYYKNNLEISMFFLGLAQNSLQYLADTILDYNEKLENVTLAHKRLKNLDSFDFFDPFNFVTDHPIRDLAELYKNDFISFSELIELFEYYNFDSKLASVFVARMLYPAEVLDLLEENIRRKDIGFRLHYNIEKELNKIKKIYKYLKDKYNIRVINWLEN